MFIYLNALLYSLIESKEYDAGLVEALVEKLDIPGYVTYLGLEQHEDAIWTAFKNNTGALVYSFFPSVNFLGVSVQELQRAKIRPADDFQARKIAKLAWPGLLNHRGSDALNFTNVFDLEEADYAELARLYDLYQDPQETACVWYKRHRSTWKSWVRFPERQQAPLICTPAGEGLCDVRYFLGWMWCFGQLFVAILVGTWATALKSPPPDPEDVRGKLDKAIKGSAIERVHTPAPCISILGLFGLKGNYNSRLEYVEVMNDVPVCLRHVRTYDNFVRGEMDKGLTVPPAGPGDRWVANLNRATLLPYLFISSGGDGMKPVLMVCVALGLASGSLASFFYQYIRWETYRTDEEAHAEGNPASGPGTMEDTVQQTSARFGALISAFIFFPAFLQVGYLGYAVNRWRSFQDLGYSIGGNIKSNALLVGASLTDPTSDACKELAYRIYRYMTLVHFLTYKEANVWLKKMNIDDFVSLGLLSRVELQVLMDNPQLAESELQKTIYTWLVKDLYSGVANGLLLTKQKYSQMAGLRAACATWGGQFNISQPNLWAALMKFVCDLLILMFVLGNPFRSFVYQLGPFQYYVILFTILQAIPWLCASNLITCLNNPYSGHHDMFNIDALISGAERESFLYLRASFNYADGCPRSPTMDADSPMLAPVRSRRAGSKPSNEPVVMPMAPLSPNLGSEFEKRMQEHAVSYSSEPGAVSADMRRQINHVSLSASGIA